MSFIKFDKAELVNLEYALSREALRSNRAGSYASTTISGCNTRKYHGLLICPLDQMEGEMHVLLSSLDVSVIQHGQEFNLGIHKYEGDLYIPRGHKYIRDYNAEKGSKMTYRVGGVVLTRETMLVQEKEQILIKITLEDAHSNTHLRMRPFLAFRSIHKLSKANLYLNRHYTEVVNGIKSRMYEDYPELFMQLSKHADFVPVPDWYYNIEYLEEQRRGYDYKEDLYVPGYFELPIKKGESVIFSASTSEIKPGSLKRQFLAEAEKRIALDSFRNCLLNSAQQFFVKKRKESWLLAGFPWHGIKGRETFQALPGLALTTGNLGAAEKILSTIVRKIEDGLFPHSIRESHAFYNSIDASLWYIWTLQQMEDHGSKDVWKKHSKVLLSIMDSYISGTQFGIRMDENGLISASENEIPLTWMESMVDGRAVTLRNTYAVEVNALWYNAVCQIIEWAGSNNEFAVKWKDLPERIKSSFIKTFWLKDKRYCADNASNGYRDESVRPNQVIAGSLKFSPLSLEMKKEMLDILKSELLTPRGLRTLSPKNVAYKGIYEGNQAQREGAAHQGTAYPWMLEHFAKCYLDVHKKAGLKLIKEIYASFEGDLSKYGIGTIAEMYDGNHPHDPKGAISYASSVASVLRVGELIDNFQLT